MIYFPSGGMTDESEIEYGSIVVVLVIVRIFSVSNYLNSAMNSNSKENAFKWY